MLTKVYSIKITDPENRSIQRQVNIGNLTKEEIGIAIWALINDIERGEKKSERIRCRKCGMKFKPVGVNSVVCDKCKLILK